jgi:hypothetical protein
MALEKARLDRSRDYGLVYGEPKYHYEQDGVYFGPDGEPVEQWSSLDKIQQERALAEKRKAKEDALARRRYEAQARKKSLEE